ncbi:zf-HC2 domain-containing protein [Pleionea litopenaei]|uniref:Zf-HC2 domain-containing protein n=1 Tax=Pleionea litopenaei TaxID=3070815 RepID=A0AA51X7A5_9GAMM|nr:zf-HC2 domain-containing protein [Pleionea sp. HL-JVS1]WMS86905.1 zf-HC2 domain-containing protein [Pleionea sp. HL-JVS1]
MSCDHQLIDQYLFAYLDSTLDPAASRAFERCIDQCEHCQSLYLSALQTQAMQQQWQEQSPPNWHRTRYAVASKRPVKWNWLNGMSFATSALALMLVLFRVEFISTDAGFSVSFGGKGSQQQVAELVESKFNDLAAQQVSYIDTRFEEQKLQQVNDNQQMLTTLMVHNRQERRQDLNTLMTSWLQQRDIDQKKLNQRVDYVVENQIENNKAINQVLKVSN